MEEIEGDSRNVEALRRWYGHAPKTVQHFCFGYHPHATFSGDLTEAERVSGCMNIGIAQYPYHADGVIVNPTIEIDGVIIEDKGIFVHKDLKDHKEKLFLQPVNNSDDG